MMRLQAVGLAATAAVLASIPLGPAYSAGNSDISQGLCAEQTQLHERQAAIPDRLLTAISLAESGRYLKDHQAIVAWPWTVTSGGKGAYFPTKAAAIRAVRQLRHAGVSNIDVGCMQINLRYHPEAFDTLDEAFDPAHNVAYAAEFLSALQKTLGSWYEAAGHYHSMDPERSLLYREKLARLGGFSKTAEAASQSAPTQTARTEAASTPTPRPAMPVPGVKPSIAAALSPTAVPQMAAVKKAIPEEPKTPLPYAPQRIDRKRTAELNAAFKRRAQASRGGDFASNRQTQLNDWRQARSSPEQLAHLVALAKAERARHQKAETAPETDFATKRRAQLAAWRLGNGNGAPISRE